MNYIYTVFINLWKTSVYSYKSQTVVLQRILLEHSSQNQYFKYNFFVFVATNIILVIN